MSGTGNSLRDGPGDGTSLVERAEMTIDREGRSRNSRDSLALKRSLDFILHVVEVHLEDFQQRNHMIQTSLEPGLSFSMVSNHLLN